jgi:hypothetical protein
LCLSVLALEVSIKSILITFVISSITIIINRNEKKYDKIYNGYRFWLAIFLDVFFAIIIFGIIGLVSGYMPKSKLFYSISLIMLINYLISSNVFFNSLGYKISRIRCKKFNIGILLNNNIYILSFVLFFNSPIIVKILIGLFLGIDSFFIMIRKKHFIYKLFNIDIYSSEAVVSRYSTKGPKHHESGKSK